MKKRWIALLMAVLFLLSVPVFVGAEGDSDGDNDDTTGWIVKVRNSANIRSKASASSSSKILGTAKRGSSWKILGTKGEYTKVEYKAAKQGYGYIYSEFISTTKPTPPVGDTVTIANCTWCRVRAKATSSSKSLGKAYKGETYTNLGTSGSWYKIQYTDEQVGYVYKTYVSKSSPSGEDVPKTGYGYVTGNTVNVREEASSSSALKGVAKKNEVYQVTAKNGNWYKIVFDGEEVYISASYFKHVTSSVKTAEIVNCKESANVRASASTSGKKLGEAELGEEYTYLAASGSYRMISYKGKVGYVHKNYVKVS